MDAPSARRTPPRPRAAARAALPTAVCALGVLLASLAPGAARAQEEPQTAGVEEAVLEDYEFLSCWGCHEAIADEWARSLHALAWEDERYQRSLEKKRRPEGCHGCHAPVPMQGTDLARKPAPRPEDGEPRHYGVSCKSCHLAPDGAMLGPIEDPVEVGAHASRADAGFTLEGSNALCIACHQTTIGPVIGIAKDFVLSGGGARGLSCVECHMAPVERPVAVDDDDRPTPPRAGRSHRLLGPLDPAFLATAFSVTAEAVEGGVRVRVRNETGHGVPGLVDRELELEAVLLDAAGEVLARAATTVTTREDLDVDAERVLELAGAGDRVRVVGTHRAEALAEPVRFLDLELAPEPAAGR